MKFRFVLLDPDGDSHRHTPPRENAAAAESADPAQAFRYQIRGTALSNRRVIHGLVKRSGDQATGEPGCAGRHRPCMKFRFVLLDPDGDSHRHTPPRENAAAAESAD